MNKIGKIIFVLTSVLLSYTCVAQIDIVRIRIAGLTCSSCSKSVEEKLIQIPFVKTIKMNLNNNEAIILVDFSKNVNWNVLAKAVVNAGFSVGTFTVPACSNQIPMMNGISCKENYFYMGPHSDIVRDKYTIIGKNFMDKKTYTVWLQKIVAQGYPDPKSVSYYYYY